MKVIRVAKDLYDYFTPLTDDDKHGAALSSDQGNGWGRWSRVRFVGGSIKVIKGSPLNEGDTNWLSKKFKGKTTSK
jgi:hypothetical protein